MWDVITHQTKLLTIEVKAWISNYMPLFHMDTITYPSLILMLV